METDNLYLSERELIILIRCATSKELFFKRTLQEFYDNERDNFVERLTFLNRIHTNYGFKLDFEHPAFQVIPGRPLDSIRAGLEKMKQNMRLKEQLSL